MFKILTKKQLNADIFSMEILAPRVAAAALAGQFIMLRVGEGGERIPLTIAETDVARGAVRIIFQAVGKTTLWLSELEEGDSIADFVGPLGLPTELPNSGKVAVVGGGLGVAIAFPQAKELARRGVQTDVVTGFRNTDLIILQDEIAATGAQAYTMTDDGSNGNKGFVTDKLRELIDDGANYDMVIAIGPLPMMRAVCELTKPYGIKTIISMNSLMIDGTGMCGCCRVTVRRADGLPAEVKFACVDGPDFDGHLVDFDEAISRSKIYAEQEKLSKERHACRLGAGE